MKDERSETSADTLRKHVEGERFLMLTSVAQDGRLASRPMTVQEFDGWTFRFIAQEDNDVIAQSEGKPVNLSFASGGTYVSLSGDGVVSRDVAQKQDLWNRLDEAYAGDAEDPANVILEVTVDQGEYWDAGNPVARVFGLAKAAITREAPAGEHGTVDL